MEVTQAKPMRLLIKYIFIIFILASCGLKKPREQHSPIQNWTFDYENDQAYNKKEDGAVSGKYFVRVDSSSMYSSGLAFKIHDSLKKNWLRVSVSFLCRLGGKRFGQSVIIAAQNNSGNAHYWYSIDLSPLSLRKDKWFVVKDSTQFYYNPKDTNIYELKVFGFNPYKFSSMDLDDLKVNFKKITYLDKNI